MFSPTFHFSVHLDMAFNIAAFGTLDSGHRHGMATTGLELFHFLAIGMCNWAACLPLFFFRASSAYVAALRIIGTAFLSR
jgi:hypothetical protein